MNLRLFSILFALTFAITLTAQPPGGFKPGGPRPEITGRLYGKLLDGGTKQAIEYATVAAYQIRPGKTDTVVGGGLTQSNGDFNLTKLPMGPIKVVFSFMGYEKIEKKTVLTPENPEQDMGNLTMGVSSKMLKEVTVSSEKSGVQMQIDHKVFNVEKNLGSQSGTAEDVLKNVPSVSIDADGAATLRNQTATILIDGRPTNLSLNQIPSTEIDQVEIITNPGARYDANTTGGILNLVMKKNNKPGYNGMVSMGASPDGRYNGMTNLNFKQGRFNVSLSYNYNRNVNSVRGYNYRTNRLNGATTGVFDQNSLTNFEGNFQFGRLAVDYALDNRNTLTAGVNVMGGRFNPSETQDFEIYDGTLALLSYGTRKTTPNNWFHKYTPMLAWKHTFPKKGQELSIDGQFNVEHSKNFSTYLTEEYLADGSPFPTPDLQRNDGGKKDTPMQVQLNYVNPTSETSKFETGAKFSLGNNHSWLDVTHYNYNDLTYRPDSTLTTNYQIREMIAAAYVNYTGTLGLFGYSAGLRFEDSYFKGTQLTSNSDFSYHYPGKGADLFKSFFPSLYLTRKFDDRHELQFNISRKINRPNFWQIMPFQMFADKLNYRIGNPALRPELINLAEINYNWQFGNQSLLSTVYVRQTNSPITSITFPSSSDPNVLVSTFVNGNNSVVFGTDNTLKINIGKAIEWTNNLNLFQTRISYGADQNSGWAYNAKSNLTVRFPLGFSLQTSANYESPRIIPQGKTLSMFFSDLSVKKDFSKMTSLTISLIDVFDTRHFGSMIVTPDYIVDSSRRRENRFIKATFMVRFGKMDASPFKNKKPQRPEGGDNGQEE